MAFPTNANQVQAFAGALYGVQIGSITMGQVNSDIAAVGGLNNALNSYYTASFGGLSTATVATTFATNLGLTGAALTAGVAYVEGQLNAVAAGARGAVISNILNLFAGLASDATFGAAATAWNAKVDAAAAYTGSANVAIGTVVTSDIVFALTTSTDTFNGGAGNDTVSGNQLTFAAGDILNGGAGTDTLSITNTSLTGTNFSVAPAAMSGIENVQISSLSSGTGAIDLAGATDVAKVISKNSAVSDSFTNIQSQAVVEIDGGSSRVVVATFLNSLAGATKTASVTLKGGTTVSELDIAGVGATEYGIISVSSEGATANTLTLIEDEASNNLAALKTLNVSGSADLTLGTSSAAVAAVGETINASSATGKLTVNGTNFETITLGVGDDTLYLGSTQVSAASATTDQVNLNGGSGANTLVFGAQDLTASGLANTAATTDNDTISNFQTVTFVAVKTDAAQATGTTRNIEANAFAGITTIQFDASNLEASNSVDGDVTVAISGLSAGQVVKGSKLASAGDAADEVVTLAMASPTDTTDSVTIESVAGTNTAVNSISTLTVSQTTVDSVAQSVETLNVIASRANVSSTVGTTIAAISAGSTTTLNISGVQNITVGTAELNDSSTADTTVAVINAAGLTGNLTLGASGADFQATDADDMNVTLGSGTNAVYGLAALDDGDTITGTTGTDTVYLTAGSGAVNLSNIDVVAVAGAAATSSAANWTGIGAVTITNSTASSTLTNLSAGQVINSDDIDSGATLTLNNKTGVTALAVNLNGATASAGTLATNATAVTINAGATSSNYAVSDAIILNATPTSVTLTGGGASGASTYAAKFTLSNSSSGLVTSVNSSYDGNLDVSGVYFDTAAAASSVTTGATSAASATTVSVGQLTNGAVHFQDNGGTDTLTVASVTGALGYINVDGFETIDGTLATSAATSLNLRDSSGYTTIVLDAGAATTVADEAVTLSAIASGTTFKLLGKYGDGSDTLTLAAATGSNDSLTYVGAAGRDGSTTASSTHASATVATSGFENLTISANGAAYASRVNMAITGTLSTDATTLNVGSASGWGGITVGTLSTTTATTLNTNSTAGAVTLSQLGTASALTTIAANTGTSATNSAYKTTITAGTTAALTGVTASGVGDFEVTALTASALTSIDASGVTGTVTLGSTSSSALTTAANAVIKTGAGNDVVSVSTTTLGAVDLGGNATATGVDLLYIVGAQGSGTAVINLNSADQIGQLNGQADSAVQTGIENVNLAGLTSVNSYGASVTGKATTTVLTGSGYADTLDARLSTGSAAVSGGAGADTIYSGTAGGAITGGAGADTITLGAGVDTVTIAANTDSQTGNLTSGTTALTASDRVYGIGNGDVLNLTAILTLGTAVAAATAVSTASVLVDSGSSAVDALKIIRGSLDEATGVFTEIGVGTTGDDYLVQVLDGLSGSTNITDVVSSFVLVNITGTVTYGATTAGVVTIGVA